MRILAYFIVWLVTNTIGAQDVIISENLIIRQDGLQVTKKDANNLYNGKTDSKLVTLISDFIKK